MRLRQTTGRQPPNRLWWLRDGDWDLCWQRWLGELFLMFGDRHPFSLSVPGLWLWQSSCFLQPGSPKKKRNRRYLFNNIVIKIRGSLKIFTWNWRWLCLKIRYLCDTGSTPGGQWFESTPRYWKSPEKVVFVLGKRIRSLVPIEGMVFESTPRY